MWDETMHSMAEKYDQVAHLETAPSLLLEKYIFRFHITMYDFVFVQGF